MLIAFLIILSISMQVTQQVYVVKDWVRNAYNKFNIEAQTRRDVEKALGTANHEKTQLVEKLKAVESARQSVEVGLKIAETQAEDQRKQLYITQINLATEKTVVLDLKAELQKAQEALKVAQEAAKAAETAAYERGILETEARLTTEVTVVCRDYCTETYFQALDRARIPTDSDLRRMDQVYYPEDIREDPTAPPPPATLPPPLPEQPLTIQDPSQGTEIPTGVPKEKKGDVGVSRPKEKAKEKPKEKTKEKAKDKVDADGLTIEDIVSKAKAAKSNSKIDSKKDSYQS